MVYVPGASQEKLESTTILHKQANISFMFSEYSDVCNEMMVIPKCIPRYNTKLLVCASCEHFASLDGGWLR